MATIDEIKGEGAINFSEDQIEFKGRFLKVDLKLKGKDYSGIVFISKLKKFLSKDLFEQLVNEKFITKEFASNRLIDFEVAKFYSFDALNIAANEFTPEYWTLKLLNEIQITGAPRKFKRIRTLDGTTLMIPINSVLKKIYGNYKKN